MHSDKPSVFDTSYALMAYECTGHRLHRLALRDSNGRTVEEYKQLPLGRGAVTAVQEYVGRHSGETIVVKKLRRDDPEVDVVQKLQRTSYACGVVRARTTFCANCKYTYVVMDKMDGSLRDWKSQGQHTITRADILSIVAQLTTQLTCLAGIGLWYTDLVPDNVLYRTENGAVFVQLGDLGSMVGGPSRSRATSYPVRTTANWDLLTRSVGEMFVPTRYFHSFPDLPSLRQGVAYLFAKLIAYLLAEEEEPCSVYTELRQHPGDRYARTDLVYMWYVDIGSAKRLGQAFDDHPFPRWILLEPGASDRLWQDGVGKRLRHS
jgi:hypothetical protein